MIYKCEICGKVNEKGVICCGARMRNFIPEMDVFTPDMGR